MAIESAAVVLMKSDPYDIVGAIELSRATLRSFHPALEVEPAEFFRVERSLEARREPGAPSRARVLEAIESARAELSAEAP